MIMIMMVVLVMSVNFVVMIFAKIGSAGEISCNQCSKNFLLGTTDE